MMSEAAHKRYATALCFCALVSACVVLECCGPQGAGNLWILVVLWVLF